MINKKLIILAIFFISLISISAVNAEDISNDAVSIQTNEEVVLEEAIHSDVSIDASEDLILDESINDNPNEDCDEDLVLEQSINENPDEETISNNDEPRLEEGPKSFSDLNNTINGNHNATIYLYDNYTFNPDLDSDFTSGITIFRNLTIYGNGITIDGAQLTRIFKIRDYDGGYAIFHNITFKNANTNEFGGAIYGCSTSINCTFINNYADRGGAIFGGDAQDSIFINNSGDFGGGAVYNSNATNCTFIDNNASYGGAMMDSVAMNCRFINNRAEDGGAIFMVNASDSTFINNTALYSGGALYEGNVRNCTFIDNSAPDHGGAICDANATNCTFINNDAGLGGAIYNSHSSDSTFVNNTAKYGGGALHGSDAINCTFINNNAPNGGALAWGDATDSVFVNNTAEDGGALDEGKARNCTFINNSATSGGAINNGNAINCTFIDNNASYGGALYSSDASDSTFINNNASLGGAMDSGNAINCTFINNSATSGGAIAYVSATDCNLTNNTAASYGGAMYYGDATNCTFINNNAVISGGAIEYGKSTGCSFMNNSADYGGAIFGNDALECTFINNHAILGGAIDGGIARSCNFTSNWASDDGGALGRADAIDCIFISNMASDEGGALYIGSASNCSFYNNSASYGGAVSSSSNVIECLFINNSASYGGAVYKSNVTGSSFINNSADYGGAISASNVTNSSFLTNFAETKGYEDIYQTAYENCSFIVPLINISNPPSKYTYGKTLLFDLTYDNQNYDGYNIRIDAYQNDELIGTYYGLTGEGLLLDFKPGTYKLVLSLEKSNVESLNMTLDVFIITTVISAENISATYDCEEFLVIDFKDDEGNPISGFDLAVELNGETKVYTTDENGQVRISTDGLVPDSYLVNIAYSGNDYYNDSAAIAKIVVIKANTELIANDISTIYNMDTYLIVTLKDSNDHLISNVEVAVELNGETKVYTTDENGQIRVSTKGVPANTYITDYYLANIRFNGNQLYEPSENVVKVVISRAKTYIVATNVTGPYNTDECIIATLIDNQGNPIPGLNIRVTVYGVYENVYITTDENGQINLSAKGLLPKEYLVILYFEGDNNYILSQAMPYFDIYKLDPLLNVDLTTRGNNVSISINANSSVTGSIEFDINNYSGALPIINGHVSYMYILDSGNYTLTVNYLGDEIFNSSTIIKEFTVRGHKKNNTTVSTNVAITGSNIALTVSLNPNATGLVKFIVNGEEVYANVENGNAILNNVFLPGEYTVSVSYLGDLDFNPNTITTSFTVKKYSTKVIASKIVTTYGTSKNLVVTLKDSNNNVLIGKKVTIKLNGKTYTKRTNGDGRISIAVPKLGVKTYTASISFAGDKYFAKSSKSIKVIVKKATPKLTAKKKTFKRKVKVKKYTITLKTNKNKALKKVKVTLRIKGKTYKAKTNSKGKATFKIKNLKKKGTYKATVKFAGNKYYKKVSKKVKIKVKK